MPVLSSISRDTDENGFLRGEKFISEKGTEYTIETTPGGLYRIVTHGGGFPARIADEQFTSHLRARDELIKYIQTTDRLGYAEYPGKPESKKRKVKEENGTIES